MILSAISGGGLVVRSSLKTRVRISCISASKGLVGIVAVLLLLLLRLVGSCSLSDSLRSVPSLSIAASSAGSGGENARVLHAVSVSLEDPRVVLLSPSFAAAAAAAAVSVVVGLVSLLASPVMRLDSGSVLVDTVCLLFLPHRFFLGEFEIGKHSTRASPKIYTRNTTLARAVMSLPTMVDFDPGDPQGGKRTSITHDQHDRGKLRALEGKDGTNLKEIGAKTSKNNKNSQIGLIGIGQDRDDDDAEDKEEDRKMTKAELEEAKDAAMAMSMARAMATETELDNSNEAEDNRTAEQLQISILDIARKTTIAENAMLEKWLREERDEQHKRIDEQQQGNNHRRRKRK